MNIGIDIDDINLKNNATIGIESVYITDIPIGYDAASVSPIGNVHSPYLNNSQPT